MAITYGFSSLTATVIGTQNVQGVANGYPLGVGNNERPACEVGINQLAAPIGDFLQLYCPTGALTWRLTDFMIQNNGASAINLRIQKRSALNTGGTSALLTSAPNLSTSPAATGLARAYTLAPAAGASVADICDIRLIPGAVLIFGDLPLDQPVELIGGGTEAIAFVTDVAATISGHAQWTEA